MICGVPLSKAFMSCGFRAPGSVRSDGLPRRDASCGLAGLTPGARPTVRLSDGCVVDRPGSRAAGVVRAVDLRCRDGRGAGAALLCRLRCAGRAAVGRRAAAPPMPLPEPPLLPLPPRRFGRGPGRRKEQGSQQSCRDASWPFSIFNGEITACGKLRSPARLNRIRRTCRTRADPRAASESRWPCASCRRSRSPCRRTASRSPAA